MVTPNWAMHWLCDNAISRLNGNGEVTKQHVLSERITSWYAFSSVAAFDYVAFQSSVRSIRLFEVFSLEKREKLEIP
jgi:hypothetical protein